MSSHGAADQVNFTTNTMLNHPCDHNKTQQRRCKKLSVSSEDASVLSTTSSEPSTNVMCSSSAASTVPVRRRKKLFTVPLKSQSRKKTPSVLEETKDGVSTPVSSPQQKGVAVEPPSPALHFLPPAAPPPEYDFKVILLGDEGVGKTSLLLRFVTEGASTCSQPGNQQPRRTAVDFKRKTVRSGSENIRLTLWDTARLERFHALMPMFYRGAHAVLLVYDVERPSSWGSVAQWLHVVSRYHRIKDILVWLVANKIDALQPSAGQLQPREWGRDFARKNNTFFIETSAKCGICVPELFHTIAMELRDRHVNMNRIQNGSTSKKTIAASPSPTTTQSALDRGHHGAHSGKSRCSLV